MLGTIAWMNHRSDDITIHQERILKARFGGTSLTSPRFNMTSGMTAARTMEGIPMHLRNTLLASTAALLASLVIASAQNTPREERGGTERGGAIQQNERGSGASQQNRRGQAGAQGEESRAQGQNGARERREGAQNTGQERQQG